MSQMSLCHKLFLRDFDSLSLTAHILLFFCIDDIILGDKEVETNMDTLAMHLNDRTW